MDKILRALYEGEIYPAEQYLPKTKEYLLLRQKQYQHYKEFTQKLPSPLDREFAKFMEEQLSSVPMELSQMFIEGYRLGAKMMIEVYEGTRNKNTINKG